MSRYLLFVTAVALLAAGVWLLSSVQPIVAQGTPKLVYAKDGSGICGYKDTPILPWCGYHVHDPDRPAPKKVTPGKPSTEEKLGAANRS